MRRLLSFFLVLLVTTFLGVAVWMSFTRFGPILLVGTLAIPVGIFFMNHQKWLYMAIFMTMFSGLAIPGLPRGLQLFQLLVALYLALSIASLSFTYRPRGSLGWTAGVLILFMLNLILIMMVQGAGFRVLGGDSWGGFRYVALLLAGLFLLNTRSVKLSPQEWKWTILVMFALSFLPMLAEMLFLLSGGSMTLQYYVVRLQDSTVRNFFTSVEGGELVRFSSAKASGINLCLGALLLYHMKITRIWIPAGMILLGMAFVGISGHRASLIEVLMTFWLFGFFFLPVAKPKYVILSLIAGVLILIPFYFFASYLPLTVQRALTFLPGIEVSVEAAQSAQLTLDWRLDVWREALNELKLNPSYWVIGKGFTYSEAEYTALTLARPGEWNYWWAVVMSTYHSGVISLLVCMGIPGLVIGSVLLVGYLFRFQHLRLLTWRSSILRDAFSVMWIHAITLVALYFLVYGDVYISFPPLLYRFALLEGLRYSETFDPAAVSKK